MTHHIKSFSQYHFRGQREDERILSVIHRHWFDIAMRYVLIFIIVAIQFTSFVFIDDIQGILNIHITILFLLMHSVISTFIWFYGFLVWIDYWLDVWIVTDRRVINIEQKGLFSRHVSELHFHTVQDVTSSVHGFIPTLLNYGDVYVQTAAQEGRFIFRRIPNPYNIKAMLVERQRKEHSKLTRN